LSVNSVSYHVHCEFLSSLIYGCRETLRVIQYAEAHGNRAAESEFDGISETNVRQKPTPMYTSHPQL